MAPQTSRLHEQALHTSALELKYERSCNLVEIIAKDEDLRRLRFDIHILEDDNDELRELLAQEEDRSDNFEKLVTEHLARAQSAETRLQDVEDVLREKEQEVGTLHAESRALQLSAADSEAFLTEKLALTRELSVLRPQLEHLKAQAACTEALMTEKLELQRQLSDTQCEMENARRDAKRAMAKRRNTGVEIAQEEQVEQLKRELAKEKRARQRAEEAADVTQMDVGLDDVRKELAREKRARQKAEEELEAAQENTQVEDVRKDLLKEKKAKHKLEAQIESLQAELEKEQKAAARAAKRADGNANADDQAAELREELAKEKKERVKAEKAVQKAADEYEAQRATLDDKLGQFRTKLKATKEKLKETEQELAEAREQATANRAQPAKKTAKTTAAGKANPKKRGAAAFDADATTLGTPGDGPAAKRGRKAEAGVGNKSTFSITPFLNRTTSILPDESPAVDVDEEEVSENDKPAASPSVAPTKKTKQPLAPSDANLPIKPKPRARKAKAPATLLEIVKEETSEVDVHAQGQENANGPAAAKKVATKTSDGPEDAPSKDLVAKKKKRKSLADFQNFNLEPEVSKKKKKSATSTVTGNTKSRKLGGLGKTLFDEEDEASAPTKGLPGRGIFAGRSLLGGKKAAGLLGGAKGGRGGVGSSVLMTAGDGSGFMFSPLKRKRGGLDDTLRG
ncbi:unnamed protein product [Zymoseptoria tritici ST99CH_1E4]|uniref:Uncharacterized protein n=1 Tax=Zymoseptoria tritici ST99CH_1E4 TaxID=1276532 RepID=A0A2H1GM78_ZYMTR|nr:unnamed protein product [Zymoseptoria tritici ST99CH_1E4]